MLFKCPNCQSRQPIHKVLFYKYSKSTKCDNCGAHFHLNVSNRWLASIVSVCVALVGVIGMIYANFSSLQASTVYLITCLAMIIAAPLSIFIVGLFVNLHLENKNSHAHN